MGVQIPHSATARRYQEHQQNKTGPSNDHCQAYVTKALNDHEVFDTTTEMTSEQVEDKVGGNVEFDDDEDGET